MCREQDGVNLRFLDQVGEECVLFFPGKVTVLGIKVYVSIVTALRERIGLWFEFRRCGAVGVRNGNCVTP